MNATEFDRWMLQARADLEKSQEAPESLERALLERLREERNTWNRTVLEVVHCWRGFESSPNHRQEALPYTRTLQLIDQLLPLTDRRPHLLASLETIRGDLLLELGEIQPAAEAYADAVDHLHGLHLDVDAQRIYGMVRLGSVLLRQGEKLDAEKVFLDVLSYPWYLIMEEDVQALMAGYYVEAGLGLIECRRGNRQALEEIFFVPAAQEALMPKLEAALEEVK